MDLATLTQAATDLSRPSHALVPASSGDDVVGFWKGSHNEDDLWIALRTSVVDATLPEGFLVVRDPMDPAVTIEDAVSPSDGLPLTTRPETSLPPLEAVFLLGPLSVKQWLASLDWPEDEPFNGNFPDPVAEAYLRTWEHNFPVYRSDLIGVIGGWHLPWPDGDWYERLEDTLLVWTVAEAEPWIEVWLHAGALHAESRIT
jgi:hypothetical protein